MTNVQKKKKVTKCRIIHVVFKLHKQSTLYKIKKSARVKYKLTSYTKYSICINIKEISESIWHNRVFHQTLYVMKTQCDDEANVPFSVKSLITVHMTARASQLHSRASTSQIHHTKSPGDISYSKRKLFDSTAVHNSTTSDVDLHIVSSILSTTGSLTQVQIMLSK